MAVGIYLVSRTMNNQDSVLKENKSEESYE